MSRWLALSAVIALAPTAAVQAAQPIGFTAAEVVRDGDVVRVSWIAPGVGAVEATASADPDHAVDTIRIGGGGAAGTIIATLPRRADGRRWFVLLRPSHGAALVVTERSLGLTTAPNFRDLGGYRTADGRWVRAGSLFRSDQLNLLSDADLARIAAAGVATVADLRTADERQRDPDRVPPGARQLVFDMAGVQDPAPFIAAVARGEGQSAMVALYRDLPTAPAARAALTGLIRALAEARSPFLFHCTAGKDRTGWASAVLLSLLGVPRETVIADYLASNARLDAKNAAILAGVKYPYTADQLRPVLTVERAFIEASFAEIDRRYGSVERYARTALGIGPATLARLRARYVVG